MYRLGRSIENAIVYHYTHRIFSCLDAWLKQRHRKSTVVESPAYDMRLPEAEWRKLVEFAFKSIDNFDDYAWRDFQWWWGYVRHIVMPGYNACNGEHRLPGAVLLKTARHLKYYCDQKARDEAEFIDRNLNCEG